jgi:hypothetical protein
MEKIDETNEEKIKNTKKYNSKYSGMTEDERKQKYRENAKAWKKKVGNKKQYEYLHGVCSVCDNHNYANIYEHNKSKKHIAKLEEKTKNI